MGPRVCDVRGFQEMGCDVTAGSGGDLGADGPGGSGGEKKEVQSPTDVWTRSRIRIGSCSISAFYNFNVTVVKFFNLISNKHC